MESKVTRLVAIGGGDLDAIYAAGPPGQHSATRIVRFEDEGRARVIEVRARVADHATNHGMILILFDEDLMSSTNIGVVFEDRIDGVMLTFVEVTELRLAEAALEASERRFDLALRTAPMFAASQDSTLRYTWQYVFSHELKGPQGASELVACTEQLDPIRREVIATRSGRRAEIELTICNQPRTFEEVATVAFDITPGKRAEVALHSGTTHAYSGGEGRGSELVVELPMEMG